MAEITYPPPPRQTANPAPPRPANSLRRTTSIDVSWPDGTSGPRLLVGRARDCLTDASGRGRILAQSEFRVRMADDKSIIAIEADPAPPGLNRLLGARAGGHLRMLLQEVMPDLIARADPLYLVLDDLSGTALVSTFAWAQWHPDGLASLREKAGVTADNPVMAQRADVCWGLQRGNSALSGDAALKDVANADAGELRNPADPDGWHAFYEDDGPGFRRARRIDVMRDEAAGLLRIDSAFQDSAKMRNGGRMAIHEYLLGATARLDGELQSLTPEARVLPFRECPGAVGNIQRLIGCTLEEVRARVLEDLRGPEGCTHLNDALRALADVPRMEARASARAA